jgi:hypothetical protein
MWKERTIIILILLTGVISVYFQLTSTTKDQLTDVAFNVFIEVLGTGITILVLDKIWHYEENKRWKAVRDDVNKFLSEEIAELFSDFSFILIPPPIVSLSADEREDSQKIDEHKLNELSRLANGRLNHIQKLLHKEQHLLDWGYDALFESRYATFNDIDTKYGKYLEPWKLKILINLERLLKSLSSNLKARQRYKEREDEFLLPAVEEKISNIVHEIVKILNECKERGLLKL